MFCNIISFYSDIYEVCAPKRFLKTFSVRRGGPDEDVSFQKGNAKVKCFISFIICISQHHIDL